MRTLICITLFAAACGGAPKQGKTTPVAAAAKPTGAWTEAARDCDETCGRVLSCRIGPFDRAEDCVAACQAAEDDDVALSSWACLGSALSCEQMTECEKAPDDAP